MSALHEVQTAFHDAMLADSDDAVPLIKAGELSADVRLQIYRNNIYSSLIRALEDLFPAVKALVGDGFFKTACHEFVTVHPPQHGRLGDYGHEFPAFLENYEAAKPLPYLPDVTRIELLWQQSYHATDVEPLRADGLASIAPEDMPNLKFALHPSAHLLQSNHPAGRIWAFCQSDDGDPSGIGEGPDSMLIIRPDIAVDVRLLDPDAFMFLDCLNTGATLLEAFENTAHSHPDFDLQKNLQDFITGGVFAVFNVAST